MRWTKDPNADAGWAGCLVPLVIFGGIGLIALSIYQSPEIRVQC